MSGDPKAQAAPASPFVCPPLVLDCAQDTTPGRLPSGMCRDRAVHLARGILNRAMPRRSYKGIPK